MLHFFFLFRGTGNRNRASSVAGKSSTTELHYNPSCCINIRGDWYKLLSARNHRKDHEFTEQEEATAGFECSRAWCDLLHGSVLPAVRGKGKAGEIYQRLREAGRRSSSSGSDCDYSTLHRWSEQDVLMDGVKDHRKAKPSMTQGLAWALGRTAFLLPAW